KGSYQLLVYLLYGCGLRSSEALNLKIKDIDTNKNQLTVSNIKHFRVLSIPTKISSELNTHISFVTQMHTKDSRSKFFNKVDADESYLFPMKQLCNNSDGMLTRMSIISNTLNYNISTAATKANTPFKVTAQTFRHSYAVRLLQNQIDIRTVQKLLGHKHASSTLIYTHIAQNISQRKSLSPLDLE
ncbi:MAG: tyrosine-type recombinase/integrase, partial [Candidatus Thioglobus sp.]|uniref:tyrosine-type recombinase/integrase n=1 Tax=Candidatus Thioglobus sp. TaxID=2026721 RepID=UPI00261F28B8